MSGDTAQRLIERRAAAVTPGLAHFHPNSTARSARGAIVVDVEGRELIDFASGIGVCNVGHCHPEVVRAVQEQAAELIHASINVSIYERYVELCEKLAELFPHGDQTKVLLVNSGAEAVENAVKIARQATGRQGVICFTDGFHGRTMMAMTMTSKVGYKSGCGPFAPEVYRVPFPNPFKRGGGLSEGEFVQRELDAFRDALTNVVSADEVAAVVIEPVQGEGGFSVAPFEYLRGLREICTETGMLLVLDEVQSGFCRTGRWAAYEHAGVTPDLSTWAKSMGGGMPIACVIGRAGVMDAASPGTTGGTYGGNPVACAASLASIRVMEREGLNARAEHIGRVTMDRFRALQARYPGVIGDVRGLGAMVAMELVEDADPGRPNRAFTAQLLAACYERGLLLIVAGTNGNIVRCLAPLVITDEQLAQALTILEEEFDRLAAGAAAPRLAGAAG